MATFAKQTFNSKNYLNYRPQYTKVVYKILYDYHKLPFDTAVDLGCGPVRPPLAMADRNRAS
jgi:trans-aconitate methyltransferase